MLPEEWSHFCICLLLVTRASDINAGDEVPYSICLAIGRWRKC